MKSSMGFELPVLSWRLIPAFSLRIRLSSVSRTLPPPWPSASCASGVAYEQPARYKRLDALGELIREYIQRIETRITKSAHIHRTTRASEVSEQWIYERGRLYFDDGVLVTVEE
jgi:hypothetical protein